MSDSNIESNKPAKKNLRYSIIDGCAASLMSGFGDSYISAYAIFLNASNTVIGLISSVPQLIGTAAQLVSVKTLDRTGNRKALILPGVLLQMLAWLPIFFLPFIWKGAGPVLLLLVFCLYSASGNFSAPAWNSLIGDLVEPDKRGDFFAKRNRFVAIFSFGSILIAGLILHLFKPINEWAGFGIIFGAAFLGRGISFYFLSITHEPQYKVHPADKFTLWDFVRRSPKSNFARFVFYVALMNTAVMVSGPFFAVYMLKDLSFSYAQFTISSVMAVLTQILSMPYWGRMCDRFGNKKIMTVTGWIVPVIPVLWLFSPNFYYILICQGIGGLIWAGFNLAAGNFIFDAVSPPKRARCVAYYSLFNNIGTFLGATIGAWLSMHLPGKIELFGLTIVLISYLHNLFLISGLMRLAFSVLFLPRFKEVREVEHIHTWKLFFQIAQGRPILEPILEPIFEIFTGGDDDEEE